MAFISAIRAAITSRRGAAPTKITFEKGPAGITTITDSEDLDENFGLNVDMVESGLSESANDVASFWDRSLRTQSITSKKQNLRMRVILISGRPGIS